VAEGEITTVSVIAAWVRGEWTASVIYSDDEEGEFEEVDWSETGKTAGEALGRAVLR